MHKSIWDSLHFWLFFSVFCSIFVLAKSLLTSQIEFAAQVLLAPLATSLLRSWRRSRTGSLLIFGHVVSFNFTLSKDKDKDKDRYKDNMGSLVIFGLEVYFNSSLIRRTFLVYTLVLLYSFSPCSFLCHSNTTQFSFGLLKLYLNWKCTNEEKDSLFYILATMSPLSVRNSIPWLAGHP